MNWTYIIYMFAIFHCLHGSYYHAAPGPCNETVAQAYARFDRMPVRQMQHIVHEKLSLHQRQALKELASSYFESEVIRPGCSDQALRRKYEVMYAIIGKIYSIHPYA